MELLSQCRALYEQAFPGEDPAFTDALFSKYFPDCIRVIKVDNAVASMLFSIPYPTQMGNTLQQSRYLYGVATAPEHRSRGYARQLIQKEMEQGPVFLRPMSESLFDYYARVGLTPFSPVCEQTGVKNTPLGCERELTACEYLQRRDAVAPRPHVRPTEEFLSLYRNGGGFVCAGKQALALYEWHGERILFKEYWGDPTLAGALTAFLGGSEYTLRRADAGGTPFGVCSGVDPKAVFLAALD